jgi:hypothetical protein
MAGELGNVLIQGTLLGQGQKQAKKKLLMRHINFGTITLLELMFANTQTKTTHLTSRAKARLFVDNVKNKDSMDLEREIQIIALDIQQGKTDFVNGTKQILSLFSAVGQSEQLVCKGKCDHGYNDEFGNELFCSIKQKIAN